MNRVLTLVFAGAAMLGLASAARATVITSPTQTVTFGEMPTDWDQSGTFCLFE